MPYKNKKSISHVKSSRTGDLRWVCFAQTGKRSILLWKDHVDCRLPLLHHPLLLVYVGNVRRRERDAKHKKKKKSQLIFPNSDLSANKTQQVVAMEAWKYQIQ
jgi:hypothetical protein